MSKYLDRFLDMKTLEDVLVEHDGNLPEISDDVATYTYGNRELLIWPANDADPDEVWVLNDYGSGWTFEQYQ